MTNFSNWTNHKAINRTSAKLAIRQDMELLVNYHNDEEQTEHYVEIWPYDDSQELPFVVYSVQQDGSLYLHTKHVDYHKELSKVEDLPLRIESVKQLNAMVAYIAECLSE